MNNWERLTKRIPIDHTRFYDWHDMPIDHFIWFLQQAKEKGANTIRFRMREIEAMNIRPETDEEFIARLKEIEDRKEKKKATKIYKEKAILKHLKKKYENG